MADTRFFKKPTPLSLAQLCAKASLELARPEDADFIVYDVASLDSAGSEHLAFLDNKKYREQFSRTKAGAVIVHPDLVDLAPEGVRVLLSKSPYKSYALAAQAFYPEYRPETGVSEFSRIHPTAKIGSGVSIGDFVTIGAHADIGDGTWIESHAMIGDGVVIGANCRIGPHASVTHAVLGKHVRLYPGVRVGQDGFGFAIDPAGFVKVPQLGRVMMGDFIEIGANTCIDRGASGDTVIGSGTWIDNLVQIGHNVKIGRGCVMVSQSGIAGSTELGDFVVIGGQVGIAGHLKIGSMARIAAQSGIMKDVAPKEEVMGCPAVPLKQFMRQTAMLKSMSHHKKKTA